MLYIFDNTSKNNVKLFIGIIGIFAFLIFLSDISFADQGYDIDEFDDLELQTIDNQKKKPLKKNNRQRLILFDDNLYLLDDDFDFGEDELELQKLKLDPNEMEIAREYEDFLNVFFENSMPISNSKFGGNSNKTSKRTKRKFSPGSSKKKSGTGSKSSLTSPTSFRPPAGKLGIGIYTIFGATIPLGQNLSQFGSGGNYGIGIDTPFSFNIAGRESYVVSEIYMSNMTVKSNPAVWDPYKITSIIGALAIPLFSSVELRAGLGLSPSSIGDKSTGLVLTAPVDINYYLPFDVYGFKFAANLHAQFIAGFPNDGTLEGGSEGTTEFINMGLLVKTPLAF